MSKEEKMMRTNEKLKSLIREVALEHLMQSSVNEPYLKEICYAIEELYKDMAKEIEELKCVRNKLRKEISDIVNGESKDYITKDEAYELAKFVLVTGYVTMTEKEIIERLKIAFDVERSCITKSINSKEGEK